MRALMLPDAGPGVGLGHVSRLLSVAQALRARGVSVRFSVRDKMANRLIRQHGFPMRPHRSKPDIAVVDSYRLTKAQHARVARGAHAIALIDDINLPTHGSDLLIQPSPLSTRRQAGKVSGQAYIPLRREFWQNGKPHIRRRVRQIFVGLGSSASPEALHKTLRTIRSELPNVEISLFSGYQAPPPSAPDRQNLRFLPMRARARHVFERMDLAIAGGGQTCLELLALGIPVIATEMAANQRKNLRAAARARALISIGKLASLGYERRLATALRQLTADWSRRRRLSQSAQRLVPSKGALAVADALIQLMSSRAQAHV